MIKDLPVFQLLEIDGRFCSGPKPHCNLEHLLLECSLTQHCSCWGVKKHPCASLHAGSCAQEKKERTQYHNMQSQFISIRVALGEVSHIPHGGKVSFIYKAERLPMLTQPPSAPQPCLNLVISEIQPWQRSRSEARHFRLWRIQM